MALQRIMLVEWKEAKRIEKSLHILIVWDWVNGSHKYQYFPTASCGHHHTAFPQQAKASHQSTDVWYKYTHTEYEREHKLIQFDVC